MPASVALVLVSHDGSRWLPAVLDGVHAQHAHLDRIVAVDTGSKDDSADLLDTALHGAAPGVAEVLRMSGSTNFPVAVATGLAEVDPSIEWIWLLHDDSNPEPDALALLLAEAERRPDADVLGPKLREWPSLRRLLELGVTISGTGRRETGLERAEYDQGQHDDVREVLAVNTAGMLVRRRVLDQLGGLDSQLPIFGNDIDFGWRAAAAGHTTLIVPQAVVFHAEAAHRGVRRTPLTGRHTHYQERRAALYTLLANAPRRSLLLQTLRLGVGTLLRVIGFLLVRSVGEALDELAALVSIYFSPGEIRSARKARRERRPTQPHDVKALLAPRWLPYRHGLDFVSDLASAASSQAADVAERRRAAAAELDPASFAARRTPTDEDTMAEDTGLVARFFTNPVAVLTAIVVVVALVAARHAYGRVAGGGLSPAPAGAREWWTSYLQSWHPLAQGTAVPAPAYLLPLALLASLLGGNAAAAISVVLVLAVPFGLWGAWRLLRVAGRLVSPRGAPRWIILAGATAYALAPVVSGAWGDGRLGPVLTGALLPWVAHAALGFGDPEVDRRWRAAWRSGLLLGVVTAFAPVTWLLALVLAVVVGVIGLVLAGSAARARGVWAPPATALVTPVLLLLPWWLPLLVHGAGDGLLLDAGRLPDVGLDTVGLLADRLDADLTMAPTWLGLLVPALAVLALLPRVTRIPVLVCWLVAVVAAGLTALLTAVRLDLTGVSTPAGAASLAVAFEGALVLAVVLGAQATLAGRPRGLRRLLAVVPALAALTVPVGGLGWFAATGGGSALSSEVGSGIPAYMVDDALTGPGHGILVVRGTILSGLTYTVLRGDGTTVGDDETVALTPVDRGFEGRVAQLVSSPSPPLVGELAGDGIEYVVLPSPADADVAASLDATGGLLQRSAEDRSTRAWQVDRPLDDHAVSGPRSWLRIVLLVLQAVAVLVVLVLCAPSSGRRRT